MMTMTRTTTEIGDVPCPFCDGEYYAELVDGRCTVVHSMPLCREFDELEVLDFLEAARLRLEGVVH